MNERKQTLPDAAALVGQTRKACIEAARKAYEDAGISGLCAEGRWECALQAMQSVNLDTLQQGFPPARGAADA